VVNSAEGLDVSNFQGNFDWAGTKGMSFGIFRLTQGLGQGTNSPDPFRQHNFDEIAKKGLFRGAYHFLDPRLPGSDQARYFIDEYRKLGTIRPTDGFWLDNEQANGVSPAQVSACADAFMATLHSELPHQPHGAYTFIDFGKEGYCQGLGNEPLWLAYPASSAPAPPPPWARWTFWQWGSRDGTDADAFNGTVAQLEKWLNSFGDQPHRWTANGHLSLADVAHSRGTSVPHLVETTIMHASPENSVRLVDYVLNTGPRHKMPQGLVYWTSNP
jgi:GH25 family lysozyme M1 (1,4-beta-N-acetylmuramidase)